VWIATGRLVGEQVPASWADGAYAREGDEDQGPDAYYIDILWERSWSKLLAVWTDRDVFIHEDPKTGHSPLVWKISGETQTCQRQCLAERVKLYAAAAKAHCISSDDDA